MSMELPHFDKLMEMAQERPQELEALRSELVENVITSARSEYQSRLRGLQFQIDMRRRLAKTPLAACIDLSRLMHDSVNQLHLCLNHPEQYRAQYQEEIYEGGKPNVLSINDYQEKRV